MLARYMLLNYTKTFFIILFVLFGLLYFYLIGEVFTVFKQKSIKIFLSYTFNLLPLVFFYISAFVSGLALILFLRRLIQKKMDLLTQSFGISPLSFSFSIIVFSLFLFLVNLIGSYELYAENQKRLYVIEKEYRKAKELEKGIIRGLWLLEEKNGEKGFYNFELIDLSTGNVYGFYYLKVAEGSIKELIVAQRGLWRGENIELKEAKIKNLFTGEEYVKDIRVHYIDLSQIRPLAERPEHLSMKSLFMLSLIGEKIGINQRYYLYEVLRRVLTALLPIFITISISWMCLRWRRLSFSLLGLIVLFSYHWLSLNLIKSFVENTSVSLTLLSFIYAPLPLLSLKGLYDLGKGFRV
ncbi:MAG: LptF/LptG family permease [Aquificota bacterium]|jgi:lipopolysaccharide export LptBFGC system permease protein LptF|nr:MAG: LptF/LptG family permease [Aquificota bacterium]